MELIQDFRHFVLVVVFTSFVGFSNSASIERPSCSKKYMLFQPRHIYTYGYTVHVSSAFLGASPSMSVSKLSCTVTINVPRRCEHIMELSDCSLLERVQKAEDTYLDVPSAKQFLEDLQRYSIYFQMNKGIIIEDGILAHDEDTLQALNFKRGIISALQVPILEKDEHVNLVDIFGSCPVDYEELKETFSDRSVVSKRNLKKCSLANIYTKHVNIIPGPSIGQMVGGVSEKPINEFIYPFEMPVSCQHDMKEDRTMVTVDCLQMQYFRPLAYTGDYLVTAMTNVSQRLDFKNLEEKKSPRPDLSLNGQSVISIKFDFGVDFNRASTGEEIRTSLAIVVERLFHSHDIEKFESVPGKFGDLVQKFRSATQDVLKEIMEEVLVCKDDCDDIRKPLEQTFFLDGLESCGTEACIQVLLLCINQGYTTEFETSVFLQGLKDLTEISETLLEKVFELCESKDATTCWLTLGTMLSKLNLSSPEDVKEDSVLYRVLHHLHDKIQNNCLSGTLLDTERQLNTALKTITNVGYKVVQMFTGKLQGEGRTSVYHTCMLNRIIPTSFKINIILNIEETLSETKYADIPKDTRDVFFEVLKDDSEDTTLRALTFSLLMKTTNADTIINLVDIMKKSDNTIQMKAYMTSAVRTLLQNDAPYLKGVRMAWEEVKKEKYFNPRFYDFDHFSSSFSKSIAGGYFFKIPVSEMFGGQIEADFIYDPSSKIFSTLKTAISYHYGDEKYQLFQFMVRVKGFDILMDALLKKINMTPREMFDLYKSLKAKAQGQGDENLAKFQQNIVKAVENILKEVNHPTELDFDISLDISVKGKEVMFISLKELMSMMREIQARFPPKTSFTEVYLRKLMSGITKRLVKSKEMVGLVRDLPTCAGLPLNLTVHAYGTHLIGDTIQSNLALFLAGGKKGSPTLSVSSTPAVRFLHELHGELGVHIGTSHSSGMKATILAGGGRELSLKLTYGYSDPKVLVENPTKKKLEFELKGIYKNKRDYLQNIFYARGRMLLHHYSGVEEVGIDNSVQTTYKACNSDQWISMITRKKMCLEFVYPDVATSKTHAYFPLSGPFDLDVTIEDLEGASVDYYTLVLEYERQKLPGAGYTDHFDITHIGTDHAMSQTKYAYCNFVYTRDDYSLTVDAELIDFHYTYAAKFRNTWHRHLADFSVYEMISRSGVAINGYLFQVSLKEELDVSVFDYHWNITTSQIGWDFHLQTVSSKSFPRKFGDRSFDISISYYCTKDMPLLYMFHLIPAWAAENNDVTNFRLTNSIEPVKHSEKKQPFNGAVEFYGRKLAWDSYVEQDGPTTRAHKVLTYAVDGVQKTAIMDYSHTWGQSMKGLTLDLSGNLDAENFNVIGTGSCTASKTEVVLSGDVNYHNKKEDINISSRKRRSSIYDRIKAAEETAVDEIVQIKNKIFGPRMVMDDPKPQENVMQHLIPLQDKYFPKYSIWDLEDWNAKMFISTQLKPVFGEGVTPGTAQPEGLEATGTFTAQYPWNGGYVNHEELFTIVTNTRNTFTNFRIQLKGDMNTSYSALDGTPVMNDGIPLVIKRFGEIHAYRKQGKIFDFVFNYNGPNFQKEYSILFDWDASTHHDPLYHVRSVQSGDIMPFWNHHFDEKLFYERGHIIHNMDFTHEMLKASMDSEFCFGPQAEEFFHQNGSVSLKVLEQMWSFDFENKANTKRALSTISPGSTPGTSYSYLFRLMGQKELLITGNKIQKDREDTPVMLWTTNINLQGSTLINVSQTWSPDYQEQMENSLRQGMVKKAMMLQGVGDHIRANMDKPVSEQSLLFVHFTPGDVIKQAVMPNFIRGMKFWGRFLGNMVPLQYRPDSPDVPGPVIAPRFSILMEAMKKSEHRGPNPMIRKLQFLDYVLLKAFSKLLLSVSESEFHKQKVDEILSKTEYSYVISTTPMTFNRIFGFPTMTEFHQHVYHHAKEAFNFYRHYYYGYNPSYYTAYKSYAVMIGKHASYREIVFQTFDGNFFKISAEHSAECSYLLASDLRQRRWSLVLSPAGVTLLTPGKTITVGWDKNVYLDNCKEPSTEISDETLTVVKTDDGINVKTPFGLSLEFDIVHDNCLVTIDGPYRNETIGLLGTNDKEKFTDFRLKHGALTKDKKQFAAEYVVAGPQMCWSKAEVDGTKRVPECDDRGCERAFTSNFYNACYETFSFRDYCNLVNNKCVQPCHAVQVYMDICQKKGRIDESAKIKGICQFETPIEEGSMTGSLETSAGSVDIVFVVSRHVGMTENEVGVLDTVSELALLEAWDQFNTVRLCVVIFGGSDEAPHVIRLEDNQNRVFVDRNDYDWDGLVEVSQQMTEGTVDIDAFDAIQEAARLPFSPVSQKLVIVLMTKEQSSGKAADISTVLDDLKEKGITLNVLSTHKKTSGAEMIGINWEGKTIGVDPGYLGTKSLPKNDYSELIMSTQGALWDLHSFSSSNNIKAKQRMSEELLTQMKQNDKQFCPAA